jgi:hypothetical protein
VKIKRVMGLVYESMAGRSDCARRTTASVTSGVMYQWYSSSKYVLVRWATEYIHSFGGTVRWIE